MAYSCSISAQPVLKFKASNSNPNSRVPPSLPPSKHRPFFSSTTAHVDPSPMLTKKSHLRTKKLILPILAGPRTRFSVDPSAHMTLFLSIHLSLSKFWCGIFLILFLLILGCCTERIWFRGRGSWFSFSGFGQSRGILMVFCYTPVCCSLIASSLWCWDMRVKGLFWEFIIELIGVKYMKF